MKACRNCPFRSDKIFPLAPGRRDEIWASLEHGSMFPCHETTGEDCEDTGSWCAGAIILMEREGGCYSNQMVRIAHRLGLLDIESIDMTVDYIFTTAKEFKCASSS